MCLLLHVSVCILIVFYFFFSFFCFIFFLFFFFVFVLFFFFQAEDGIRDLVRSRGLGDVYKRQGLRFAGPILAICDGDVLAERHAG